MLSIITAFYILKSKFPVDKYMKWIDYFLTNIKCNIIIFTNKKTYDYLKKYNSSNIKLIICELNEFYNYKYVKYWKKNHEKNTSLKDITSWKLNMLWSEKISFVRKSYDLGYINTEWCCWCDIGYFRKNECGTLTPEQLNVWPSENKIKSLDINKIYYGMSHNDKQYFNMLIKLCLNKNENNLPINDIPENQCSISGGFFLIHKNKINWWFSTYDYMLKAYFENNRLVKDDQIIIVNAISLYNDHFNIIYENNNYNHWFLFQRWLN
jgi:hypothetical protein